MNARACPTCATRSAAALYAPFCSKRCADVDLQRWFAGSYAIPVEDTADESSEAEGLEE